MTLLHLSEAKMLSKHCIHSQLNETCKTTHACSVEFRSTLTEETLTGVENKICHENPTVHLQEVFQVEVAVGTL